MSVISNIKLKVKASRSNTESLELERIVQALKISVTNFSEDDLINLMDTVVDLLKEARAAVLEERTSIYEFQYHFFDEDQVLIEDKRYAWFFDAIIEEAVKYPSLHKILLEFVDQTYHEKDDSRFWQDSEIQAGNTAAVSLALCDKKYIENYKDFLRTNDMDHEVNQYGDINDVINKHGACEETFTLAVARACSVCGQHGSEQFNELLEQYFLEYIKSNFDFFLKRLKEEHTFKEIWFLDEDYEEFWNPGDMYPGWIDTVLEVLDESQKEKFRLFFKERL
ncbi:hypothetical protein [Aquimarina sp. SS2-1]|uniref:hypothetical protein n=1 Tax=Aquimarina besae TaxID=3342247 RepID=UPI00366F2C4F